MEFNERLKEKRKEKNFSQKQIAELFYTRQQTISKWEKGILEPSYQDLKKLCNILDTTSDYLIGLENEDGTINYYLGKEEQKILKKINKTNISKKEVLKNET